jgi:hypothetical protein
VSGNRTVSSEFSWAMLGSFSRILRWLRGAFWWLRGAFRGEFRESTSVHVDVGSELQV